MIIAPIDADSNFREQCMAAYRRDVEAAARRRAAYIAQVSQEAAQWWRHVHECYEARLELLMALGGAAAVDGDEERFQHFARRVGRWRAVLQRLDSMMPRDLFVRYCRIRGRADVVAVLAAARQVVQ